MAIDNKEVVISTESVNCYGARVLTDGIDTSQYERNPVLLYMHQRFGREDMPIGRIENLHKEDGKLIGTPVFDLNDPYAQRVADKWESGFLRMVSPSMNIIATSDEPDMILAGQLRPTVTKSKLVEISVVDIGGNDDALPLQLRWDGQVLELSGGEPCDALPLLKLNHNKTIITKHRQMEQIFLALGLSASATDKQALEAIATLKAKADSADKIQLSAITAAVYAARDAGKFTADKADHFIALGRTAGLEALNETLALMHTARKPTDIIDRSLATDGRMELTWRDLTPETAERLKTEKPDQYEKLYRAEFGQSAR